MNFDDLAEMITDNHLEVCQRLSRLETQSEAFAELPERVSKLENFKFTVLGFSTAVSALVAYGASWFKRS